MTYSSNRRQERHCTSRVESSRMYDDGSIWRHVVGLVICMVVITMNRLSCIRKTEEGCSSLFPSSVFIPLLLSLPPKPQPHCLKKKKKKNTTQHQNSRPELRLSHKKTKHPFNLSSYYIAIFYLFDLRTMPRICLRLGCFQALPLCYT